jgi:hypothetical protein
MNGNRLDIQASVDLEGLKKLQTMLEKYQSILEMMQPDAKDNIFNERGRQLRRPLFSKCVFFFDGLSAAIFGPIAALF